MITDTGYDRYASAGLSLIPQEEYGGVIAAAVGICELLCCRELPDTYAAFLAAAAEADCLYLNGGVKAAHTVIRDVSNERAGDYSVAYGERNGLTVCGVPFSPTALNTLRREGLTCRIAGRGDDE